MYKIVKKEVLNNAVELMEIHAPFVARKCEPGQFIIIRVDEDGERVPLTIADYDREKETVTIIYQVVGYSTELLSKKQEGDYVADFVGPLGVPAVLEKKENKVIGVAGGVGAAPLYPQLRKLAQLGTKVDVIIGGKSAEFVLLAEKFAEFCDNVYIATDDGSLGTKGFVTTVLQDLLDKGEVYDECIAIGPLIMMKNVVKVTQPIGLHTMVSLNPIMIDGTGMCGGCRVTVGGETKFACVDGPDFDGFKVDFDECRDRDSLKKKNMSARLEGEQTKMAKKNMSLTKVPMPEQDPNVRNKNFDEVALGYTAEMAMEEATRCLNCKNKPCVNGCPVNVPIPEFIEKVAAGDFEGAYEVITSENALPAICGRVCPQENQCEGKCVRGIKGEPVGIGRMERFVADYHMANAKPAEANIEKNGKKVAVVGSGPAGITCAGELIKKGYDVTVFEALHKAGGVLSYGIPEFRLPKALVAKEIKSVEDLGVKIETNVIVGRSVTIDELMEEGYEAVFVGSGAGLPRFLNIPGENLLGVYSANEFLTRVNLMKGYKFPETPTPVKIGKRVAVVGAGNVAMDAARTAKRLGAEEVYIVYRRSEEEAPARLEELHHAKEEGIIFKFLNNPAAIVGDENGWVKGMEVIEQQLGEPDASGRRRPEPIEGSNYVLDVETVVIAIGQSPNPLIRQTTPGLECQKWGGIIVNEETMESSKENVYAGGDTVTGAATVILAMGAGKRAAAAIDEKLSAK